MTAMTLSSKGLARHPAVLVGAAAVGLVVGLAANFGRKAIVQGVTAAQGEWDEGLKAEHRATLKIFDAIEATDESNATRRNMYVIQLKHALSKHAFEEENVVYAHLTGGYAGGQAEYVRVPYSDVGPVVIPDGMPDDEVLFLSDILPTGWQAAVNADIEPGDTVAVWGCGPVGLFTIQSALLLGAARVIAIDHFPTRLALAKKYGAEILDYGEVDVREALDEMTGGVGPDACIDCVGMESHGFTVDNVLDQVKAKFFLTTERPHALRQAILACRKGGRLSIPGVYGGFADKFPLGQLMEKGLTVKSGQTHVQRYTGELLDMIRDGKFDTISLISHHAPLEDAAEMYRHWHDEQDRYTKIVLKPGLEKGAVQALQEMAHA